MDLFSTGSRPEREDPQIGAAGCQMGYFICIRTKKGKEISKSV